MSNIGVHDKSVKYSATPTSVIFFIPMLLLVFIGYAIGHITSPIISGFIAGRKKSKDFWHFDDLEKDPK